MTSVFDLVLAVAANHASVDRWDSLINTIASSHGVPPNLVKAVMLYESGGDPTVVGSSGRGCGLMQIDYGTAFVNGRWIYTSSHGKTDQIFDPGTNLLIACRDFLQPSILAFPDDLDAVIASYNAGIGPVKQARLSNGDLTKVTFAPWYVPKIHAAYEWFVDMAHAAGAA